MSGDLLKSGFNVHLLSFQCFKPAEYPEVLREYFEYVCQLEFKTKPDYKKVNPSSVLILAEYL